MTRRSRIAFVATLLVAATCFAARATDLAGERSIDDAIAASLKWLAAQQRDDGGWAFDGKEMPRGSSTAATGMVLLAFFEAGQTHKEGKYKEAVNRGLAYLAKEIRVEGETGDLRGRNGDMVAHAMAACALLEAYAMTHDKELLMPAQQATKFIEQQQDEKTGGWRRDAMSPPSMLSFGWQLLALKRAHMAYLQVNKQTVVRATSYLDHVQQNEGRFYAEGKGNRERRATAVALLTRLMLGWKRSDERLAAGMEFVGSEPQSHDAMHNFFAHQLHYGGSAKTWPTWRDAIRKQLMESQQAGGDETGSWFDPEDRDVDCGRLQQTALNSLILSMFRRGPLPILPEPETDDDFPL